MRHRSGEHNECGGRDVSISHTQVTYVWWRQAVWVDRVLTVC